MVELMQIKTPQSPNRVIGHILAGSAMLLVIAMMVAIWLVINLHNRHLNGWMAIPTAVDAWLLLFLSNAARGRVSQCIGTAVIVLSAALAVWLTAAIRIGRVMGFAPLESLRRMDPWLAWEILCDHASVVDWLCFALALGLGWWLLRSKAEQPD